MLSRVNPQRADATSTRGLHPIVADITRVESLSQLPAVQTVLFAVGYDRSAGHAIEQVYVDGLAVRSGRRCLGAKTFHLHQFDRSLRTIRRRMGG